LGILEERPLILEYDAPFWRTHERQHLYEKLDRDLGEANWGLLFDRARWSKSFLVAGSILLIFASLANSTALAQESLSSSAYDGAFPDHPNRHRLQPRLEQMTHRRPPPGVYLGRCSTLITATKLKEHAATLISKSAELEKLILERDRFKPSNQL
jgi:hypothetical protein